MYSLSANTLIEAAKLQSNFDDLSSGVGDLVSNSLETTRRLAMRDYLASGGVITGDSYGVNKNASMTALIAIIGGKYVTSSAVSARSYTASKDTYVDVDNTGALTYTEVANNAASPALAANNIRLAMVVTGATTIASASKIAQYYNGTTTDVYYNTDSLGNALTPNSPNFKLEYAVNNTSFGNGSGNVGVWTIIVPTGGAWLETEFSGNYKLNAAPAIGITFAFQVDAATWYSLYRDNYTSSSDTTIMSGKAKRWLSAGSHTVRIAWSTNGNATFANGYIGHRLIA